jgi:hypothetical protein
MSAVIAHNLRTDGFVVSEKALCTDCGTTVHRQATVTLGGPWVAREPDAIGERAYACVALRQKSA